MKTILIDVLGPSTYFGITATVATAVLTLTDAIGLLLTALVAVPTGLIMWMKVIQFHRRNKNKK